MAKVVAQDVRIISTGIGKETFVLVRCENEEREEREATPAMQNLGMEFPPGYRVLQNVRSVRWECAGRSEKTTATVVFEDVPVDVVGEVAEQ